MISRFFLPAKARAFSLVQVDRILDDQARATFRAHRLQLIEGGLMRPASTAVCKYQTLSSKLSFALDVRPLRA